MRTDPIEDTLRGLGPEDLEPVWRSVDSLERAGWVRCEKASRWKHAIVDRMECLGLDTGGLSWSYEEDAPDPCCLRRPLPS